MISLTIAIFFHLLLIFFISYLLEKIIINNLFFKIEKEKKEFIKFEEKITIVNKEIEKEVFSLNKNIKKIKNKNIKILNEIFEDDNISSDKKNITFKKEFKKKEESEFLNSFYEKGKKEVKVILKGIK